MRSLDLDLFLLVLSMYLHTLKANLFNSTAQAPALWTNNGSLFSNHATSSGVKVRAFLFSQKTPFTVYNSTDDNHHSKYSSFACGFYCYNDACNTFLFGIFITIDDDYDSNMMQDSQLVWTANRSHPVKDNATVQLSRHGSVVLKDSDGTLVWSAGTLVTSMVLLESGNLVLFDSYKSIVWQSFDHPTDTLVLGQTLSQQKMIADASPTNPNPGLFYLSVVEGVLNAFAGYDTPIIYFSSDGGQKNTDPYAHNNITFLNGNITFSDNTVAISLPSGTTAQFIRLEPDGHLRHYQWLLGPKATPIWNSSDILPLDYCDYPLSCGEYGVCSKGQCTCPSEDTYPFLFRPIDNWQPNQGCIPIVPLSCKALKGQTFVPLTRNVTYYDFSHYAYVANEESCKAACLNNCSCKVAFFDHSTTRCYITSEMLSISVSGSDSYSNYHNLSAFIKVQIASGSRNFLTEIVIGSAFSGVFLLFLFMGAVVCYMKKSKKESIDEEDAIPQIPGMPRRFSLAELKSATWDFSEKLGVGGFGSVFEGEIGGEKVAVKRLNSVSQGKEEFMTEVRTIGGINNVNLVRLIGYCAEKSERLLVYEYMQGGSLDKWIFDKRQSVFLDWNIRCKLLLDVAKGLLYLHEECRQRIAHLDIKPQNILLDDNLNAKVSDFGLAKLIDTEQSRVITRMRGTPGYLAPEWLTHVITEKADNYSFGVVILEILCGRRNLDHTQQEENVHLISVLRDKIRKNKLPEIIDSSIVFAELHLEEIIRMIKLAMWCLESDSSRRPNMSVVVKILEGAMDFEADLEDHFFNVTPAEVPRIDFPTSFSSPLPESLLSGPR